MEDFDIDLTLDEAAEARIAHAEYLNAIKDWGMELGSLLEPFAVIAEILMNEDRTDDEFQIACRMFPLGLTLTIEHVNAFYGNMQKEAVKVLGAPFMLHEMHHPRCGENGDHCGHQDHYMPKEDK